MRDVSYTPSGPARCQGRGPGRSPERGALARRISEFLSVVFLATLGTAMASEAPVDLRGLPFTRFYSFDEIGDVSAGARLAFDPLGRLAVVHQGAFVVLNDTTWLDIASKEASEDPMLQVVDDGDGHFYYGAFRSWGVVDFTSGEKLHTKSLAPASCPDWIAITSFTEIVVTSTGVYFGGWYGVVYWDRTSQENMFFSTVGVTKLFAVADRVFVYSHGHRVQYIDVGSRSLRDVDGSRLAGAFIDQTTSLDQNRTLVATSDQRLMTFDGEQFAAWSNELGDRLKGRVSSLKRLVDGGIAIAVSSEGLYLVSEKGEILSSLTDPDHQRITDLAAHEPGVLWVVTENGVEKVLYRSPVAVFGQRLGLPISWPQVVRWHDRIVVASGGVLYEASSEPTGATAHFQPVAGQPTPKLWGIAANGPRMMVGNAEGVFARNEDGTFTTVLAGVDVARLVMPSPDFCYFVGGTEIGALHWENGRWSECAARVPGVGYPSVVRAAKHSAWIELGGNRVARISFRDGRLRTRVFEKFPWSEARWTNVGVVGDTVVLAGRNSGRLFFDENTESFVDAPPQLRRLLDQVPFWIMRIQEDSEGTLWATYDRGVLTMRRTGDGFSVDTTRFEVIHDRDLNIQLLPGGDVWFSTGLSLYHVDRRYVPEARPRFKPVLGSLSHGRTNEGIAGLTHSLVSPLRFPYSENSLSFRFFAGSYAARRSPGYEFRLNRRPNSWTSLATGSLLTLPNLQEGTYRVDVRLADNQGPLGAPLAIGFEIGPPWFRTWYAYALYGIGAALAAFGLVRWLVHRANVRSAKLETLVRERTGQLEVATEKLNEETRNAATLAERDRLAVEIHDSVQQGLSGLMLQLDATLKLPAITNEVRSRLSVARNMVSFTRHEVQHAVWDMESPLLRTTELGDALKKIADLVTPGAARIDITVTGTPVMLSSSTKHHLLRIAQEAITNAVRHASPAAVNVILAYETDGLSLTVTDDGCGFKPNDVLVRGIGHFGLRGLRERAGKISGLLEIHSAPGEGTVIKIIVPACALASPNHHAIPR